MARTRIRWRWTAWVAVALLGAGTAVAGKPGGGSPPPSGPPAIAYFQDGSLKTMAADGGSQTLVLAGAAAPLNAGCSWSPDGLRIAFQGNLQGDGVYVVNRDGTGLQKVHYGFATDPAWSPSTDPSVPSKIAFKAVRTDGTQGPDIWLVNPDGGPLENLTNTAGRTESYPTWSPDGRRLAVRFNAFVNGVNTEAGLEIYDLAFDASGVASIASTTTVVEDFVAPDAVGFAWLEWSRAGDRLAYSRYDEATAQWDLWVLALSDASRPVRLTETTNADEREPSWAPDDASLVFERFGKRGFKGATGLVRIDLATRAVTSLSASSGRYPNRMR